MGTRWEWDGIISAAIIIYGVPGKGKGLSRKEDAWNRMLYGGCLFRRRAFGEGAVLDDGDIRSGVPGPARNPDSGFGIMDILCLRQA